MNPQRKFAERFLAHLNKIGPEEIENFVKRTVRERDFITRILETLTEGIVVIDPLAKITITNAAARRILRLPAQTKLQNELLPELLPEGPLRDLVLSFLSKPRVIQDQEILLRSNARKIYNVHLLPIETPDAGGTFESAALILQDLTPSLDRQMRTTQAEKIASLATLTAGVAHEIKNPLNSLSIHAQLLARVVRELGVTRHHHARPQASFERIQKSCDVIAEEVERLRKCVDDFIDAARPRRPLLAPANLNQLVSSVAEAARLEFEERQIHVEVLLESDLPPILLDEKQMRHALRNLLRNAIEAIENARRPAGERHIALRTAVVGDMVQLVISDSGDGIASEDLPKIFEPYFTTKFNGSGLGLMAVARIIREHDGEVSVSSQRGEGATFTLGFPVLTRQVKLLASRKS
jgi:two-component system, sporulation sensor kinase E